MNFPTIPHNFPEKTFGEVFNRMLNVYLLENDVSSGRLLRWGNISVNPEYFVCIKEVGIGE